MAKRAAGPTITVQQLQSCSTLMKLGHSREHLAQLLPSVSALLDDVRDLWDIDVSESEMAVIFVVAANDGHV
jgi:hypothetical protein